MSAPKCGCRPGHTITREQLWPNCCVDGVSAVYTFPAVRQQGYGGKVITAATSAIDRGDADLALLSLG